MTSLMKYGTFHSGSPGKQHLMRREGIFLVLQLTQVHLTGNIPAVTPENNNARKWTVFCQKSVNHVNMRGIHFAFKSAQTPHKSSHKVTKKLRY
ncbi:hypothetical protein DMENIID0001_132710 [Sergentomyia squamirostris]